VKVYERHIAEDEEAARERDLTEEEKKATHHPHFDTPPSLS
jgi:hypothetical protein